MNKEKMIESIEATFAATAGNTSIRGSENNSPNKFYFLLKHPLNLELADQISWENTTDGILLKTPEKLDMVAIMKAFDEFYLAHPDQTNFSDGDIRDPVFIQSQGLDTSALQAYHDALALGVQMKANFDAHMSSKTLTPEDEKLLDQWKAHHFPAYISYYIFRNIITIENLAEYDLDEHPSFQDEISNLNKVLNFDY